jgi:hypothetical protein
MDGPDSYDLPTAVAEATTGPRPKSEIDPQASAERAYMRRFAAGDFGRQVNYGNGEPTKAKHSAVVS